MNCEEIYKKVNESEEKLDTPKEDLPIEKEDSKVEKDTELEENKETQKDPKDLWNTAKKNVEEIEKDLEFLMRTPAVERVGRADDSILRGLKGLGTTVVGLSAVLGGLLKLGNTFIPGFGLVSVPSAHALGGTRVIGQSMIDKGSPLKPVSRVAPSTRKVN